MSVQDAAFLHIENGNNPMHIGSVAVLEGPAPAYGDLVRLIAVQAAAGAPIPPEGAVRTGWSRTARLGRRPALPDPVPHSPHRGSAARRPGRAAQSRRPGVRADPRSGQAPVGDLDGGGAPARSLGGHLQGPSLHGGRRLGHRSAHGDVRCHRRGGSATAWRPSGPRHPSPEPSPSRPMAMVRTVADPLGRLRDISGGLRITAGPRTRLAEGAVLLRSLAEWSKRSATSLNGPIGPHRRWSWAEASLDDVKTVRHGLGGTVNDVVLAAITAGFRSLLLHRGEDVSNRVVRTLVPVSVRADSERGVYNNRVSGIFPGLPVSIADPGDRLNAIAAQLSMLKGSKQAVAGDALVKLAGFAPPMLLVAWRAARGPDTAACAPDGRPRTFPVRSIRSTSWAVAWSTRIRTFRSWEACASASRSSRTAGVSSSASPATTTRSPISTSSATASRRGCASWSPPPAVHRRTAPRRAQTADVTSARGRAPRSPRVRRRRCARERGNGRATAPGMAATFPRVGRGDPRSPRGRRHCVPCRDGCCRPRCSRAGARPC